MYEGPVVAFMPQGPEGPWSGPAVRTKIKDTTKSHREVIFHVFGGNSPRNQIQPKLAYK